MPVKRIMPLLVVLAGCASVPAARIPYEEAFGRAPSPTQTSRKVPTDPRTSPQLHSALFTFSDRVEAARLQATRGQKMPQAPADAWLAILAELELFLVRTPAQTSPFDVARARIVLQSQLETDAQLYGDFPAAVAEGVQRSLSLLSARLALVTPVQKLVDLKKFAWPLQPVVITSPFGHRVHPISGQYRFHSGLDLLADPAQPVRAAFDGMVVFSAWNGSFGKQVELQHDPRFTTRYSHLQTLLVPEGSKVKKGDVIGLAGSTGQSTGIHLHFELMRNGEPEDPEEALASSRNGTSPGFPQSSSQTPPMSRERVTAWP